MEFNFRNKNIPKQVGNSNQVCSSEMYVLITNISLAMMCMVVVYKLSAFYLKQQSSFDLGYLQTFWNDPIEIRVLVLKYDLGYERKIWS